jgi:hypothetical protein
MLECTTGLSESLVGAEGADALVHGGVPRAEGPEHFSGNGPVLVPPLLAVYDCVEGIEEPHVDRIVELPLDCELVLDIQYAERGHLRLLNMIVLIKLLDSRVLACGGLTKCMIGGGDL